MADGGIKTQTGGPSGPTAMNADTARAYRDALGRFATGVTVITAQGPSGPLGFTANSFASVSMDPPLVLWSPAKSSSRFGVFSSAPHFAIHVLAEDQSDLCMRFAKGQAGFADLAHAVNAQGVPVLPGVLARFDCAQHATHDGGDHLIVVGRVLNFDLAPGRPLLFSQGRMCQVALPQPG